MRSKHIPVAGTSLTPFEKQVLRLVSQGYTNTEIAKCIGRSRSSIGICIWRIKARLGIDRDLRLAILKNQYEKLWRSESGK